MARSLALLLLVACSACMEMRETVERMVMVRTTGSDLQPAATGFIYKKESDGPPSVVEMGESEVMEHLTKLYEQPKSFAAPIPVAAGPFYAKDEEKLPAHSETKVIPVTEKEEQEREHIPGIVDEDYEKILGEHPSKFGDYKSDFDDYLKSLGYSEDGEYSGHVADDNDKLEDQKKYSDGDAKDYGSQHKYKGGGAADYDTAKYESYATSESTHKKSDFGDPADEYTHGYKSTFAVHKAGNDEGEAGNGFHNLFDKDEYEKDHGFDDGETIKNGHHKLTVGDAHRGPDGRTDEEGVDGESGFQKANVGTGFHDEQSRGQQRHSSERDEEADDRQGILSPHFSSSYYYKVTH